MKNKITVWVVSGKSESCDDYGPVVYSKKPSHKILKALCEDWDAGEWDGPGDYDSYVHLDVNECEVN